MKKIIAIVGVPRSGTSATSNVNLEILGKENLIGSSFMGRDEENPKMWQGPRRELTPIQKLEQQKRESKKRHVFSLPDKNKRIKEMKEMNEKGFFECPFTVKGLFWSPETDELFKKINELDRPFMKLVCSGIANTNPEFIERIIYVLRCPREVAKSQEKLKGRELPKGEVIHSPDFYIKTTTAFCRWYINFGKDIPLLMVNHRDLLEDPETQTKRIADFHGLPHNNAHEIIEKKLYRSKIQDIKNDQWVDADRIFELMKKSDFQGVVDYMRDPDLMTHKVNKSFRCHRLGRDVNLAECRNCKSNDTVVSNFIITATKRNIDWKNEPCALDCGAIDRDSAISVEKSIANHTWLYHKGKIGTIVKGFIEKTKLDKIVGKCKGCNNRENDLDFLWKVEKNL